jgi:hypothetical protein
MGNVSWSGGSREVVKPKLKMEDVYSLCNVIEFFCQRKVTKIERGRAFWSFQTLNGMGTIV